MVCASEFFDQKAMIERATAQTRKASALDQLRAVRAAKAARTASSSPPSSSSASSSSSDPAHFSSFTNTTTTSTPAMKGYRIPKRTRGDCSPSPRRPRSRSPPRRRCHHRRYHDPSTPSSPARARLSSRGRASATPRDFTPVRGPVSYNDLARSRRLPETQPQKGFQADGIMADDEGRTLSTIDGSTFVPHETADIARAVPQGRDNRSSMFRGELVPPHLKHWSDEKLTQLHVGVVNARAVADRITEECRVRGLLMDARIGSYFLSLSTNHTVGMSFLGGLLAE
ncbi:hypothetical protein B0J12DRAFT_746773 [Macrophomina phaseolina]|uniref:Uncharacterized protein n=1 Tax=Macrophomina phaseolina TaxID=35725 RepID=A0ABQ8FRR8_9PEZI|nr:hypothetical protein B0J12DRAFT_746773 [Macrophomina phaseolina]